MEHMQREERNQENEERIWKATTSLIPGLAVERPSQPPPISNFEPPAAIPHRRTMPCSHPLLNISSHRQWESGPTIHWQRPTTNPRDFSCLRPSFSIFENPTLGSYHISTCSFNNTHPSPILPCRKPPSMKENRIC
jgi:hypothetical protein